MAIVFRCGCGQKLSTRDDLAGRSVRCPGCTTVLKVPVPERDAAAENDQGYALEELPPAPAPRPARSEGSGAAVGASEPAQRRPRPESGAGQPGAERPRPRVFGAAGREVAQRISLRGAGLGLGPPGLLGPRAQVDED